MVSLSITQMSMRWPGMQVVLGLNPTVGYRRPWQAKPRLGFRIPTYLGGIHPREIAPVTIAGPTFRIVGAQVW